VANRPAGIYCEASMTLGDAGGELSNFKVSTAVVDDENAEAQLALWDTLKTRIGALVLGDVVSSTFVNTIESGFTRPTNGANRETKLLVQYKNVTSGKRYTVTLPTLNPEIPVYVDNINAKDVIRVDTPAAITQFITAFEAFAQDPQVPLALVETVGAAIEVVGLKVVGRNI